ncbi:hypothetical protein [Algicola sagamiensis]|uniref:hypothetical protein n=1 Tax=Algicola sagamiensis TaxID=163869 RepID=UPI0003818B9A|nr:hypothetical protein [Algicola sagamiensis]
MEKIKYNLSCLFIFLFISITLPAQANQKIIEALQFGSDYINPQLSPDGKHLAVQYLDEGEYKLVILSTKDFQVKVNLYGRSSLSVGDFHWISNNSCETLKNCSRATEPLFGVVLS